jgi:hypothetical protein
MKKTTWVDGQVVSWLRENAVVTPMDVDQFPQRTSALRVRAMPTMILFRGEQELARTVGYQSPTQFASWLQTSAGGAPGAPAIAGAPVGAAPADDAAPASIQDRLDSARDLAGRGEFDKATEAYAWLWEHMLESEPSFYGVRLSFMAGDMTELAAEHAPALAAFTALRDKAHARLLDAPADWETLTDWVHLNGIINDPAATVAWAERLLERGEGRASLERFEGEIIDHALLADRRDIIPAVVPDPVASARQALQQVKQIEAFTGEPAFASPISMWFSLKPALVAALLTQDDRAAERALIDHLTAAAGDQDAWRVALLAAVAAVDQERPDLQAWIAEHDLLTRYPEATALLSEFDDR